MHRTFESSSRLEPTEIAPDTFVVHAHVTDGTGLVVPVNTMVIRSVRPVVVDTGLTLHCEQFIGDVCSLVDAEEIGWIFVTHSDGDHAGNLTALLAAAPNATVLTRDLDRIDIGDRTLSLVWPPLSDAADARGVFDPTTGVYWAADDFGTTLMHPATQIAEVDPDQWHAGIATFAHHTAAAAGWPDDRSFQSAVDAVEGLGASVIAGSHTPIIGRLHVDQAITAVRRSISAPPPDRTELDAIDRLLGP